jgi:hypothetical protein
MPKDISTQPRENVLTIWLQDLLSSNKYAVALVLNLLTPQFLGFAPLALNLCLVGVDLTLLLGLAHFLSLELVTDKRTGSQSERPPYRSAHTRRSHGSADDPADRCTAKGADSGSLLARRQIASGTADEQNREQYRRQTGKCSSH